MMPTPKFASRIAGGTVVLTLLVGAVVVIALLIVAIFTQLDPTDPDQQVGVVNISDARAAGLPAGGASVRRVAGLDEVRGFVVRDDVDDVDDLTVGRVELDFGPDDWIARAGPMQDYDADGSLEPVRDELAGLVGAQARFLVRLDNDGDDGDVYTINDRPYRDPAGAPPWHANGAGEAEIRRAAAAAVGEGAIVTKLEADDDPVAWEAEVVDTAGREYKVDLDPDGKVLAVEAD